jgi:hypothetical protein
MTKRFGLLLLTSLAVLYACEPVPVQYPPGSGAYPAVPTPSQPNATPSTVAPPPAGISGSQRWQHAWNKAIEGVVMGGSIGGPYGAGGGLVIGLITGLFTADSYYGQINSQIQVEQTKDQQLEAAIEQELARQRELENQIAQAGALDATTGQTHSSPPSQNSSVVRPPADGQRAEKQAQLASLPRVSSAPSPSSPFKNVEIKDINADGIPDLWVYYDPQNPSEVIRQEEASKADGRVDTWSYFKGGKMVRREVDTRQSGRADTVYFYENDQIAREERDESGRGSITYRATYQDGRLAKVERDSSGGGRPDQWTYYDARTDDQIVLKEERDFNGDGIPDLWSFFENGRLVRRDVSAVGLEILSKQEQLPASAELTRVSLPGG